MSFHTDARILVIDSWAALRVELAAHLGVLGHNVVVADPGPGVVRVMQVFQPHVVIIEASDEHPEAIVGAIRSAGRALVIVTVASSAPPERRARAMRAGADDVLVKPFELDELTARIESLMLRSGAYASLSFGDVSIDEVGHRVFRGEAELELTVTEFNLLAMFLRNAGRVLSKRQLLGDGLGLRRLRRQSRGGARVGTPQEVGAVRSPHRADRPRDRVRPARDRSGPSTDPCGPSGLHRLSRPPHRSRSPMR